jgi:N-acetylmuramoyl-L-alanine amidase
VKRAPFVVLIGAGMPSVLAEISFVTNKQEAALLRTGAYRQRIAEALFDAVTQYQRSLKKVTAVADSASR